MHSRSMVALALAGLFLLAGCAAITGGGDGGGDYPAAEALNASAVEGHEAALSDASFTTTIDLSSGENFTTTTTFEVDPDDDQYLLNSSSMLGQSVLYTSGDDSYQRTGQGENAEVVRSNRPVDVTSAQTGGGALGVFVSENVTYDRAGTETVDGTEVMRYEAEGVDALSDEIRESTGENATVNEFSAAVLIDGDGVIRQFESETAIEQNGQTAATAYEISVTGVGSTDVEEPDWVSRANESG